MPNVRNHDHSTTPVESGTISKPPTPVSLRPRDFVSRPTCAEIEYIIVVKVSVSGRPTSIRRYAQCHRAECARCSTPAAHEERMWERRGWRSNQIGEARAAATQHLLASGCTQLLDYSNLAPDKVAKCLAALQRSHAGQKGISISTADHGTSFLVTPKSAEFVRERLGEPVAQGQVGPTTLANIMERGYRRVRGWGAESGARFLGRKPRSLQSPLSPTSPVSFREFICGRCTTEEGHRREGRAIPDELMGRTSRKTAAHARHTSFDIDDGASAVAPLKKETTTMNERQLELLERIARNTDPLPQLAAFVQEQITQLRADYKAGLFDGKEYVRRYRKLRQASHRIQ
jgi:hypothetical protein